MGLLPGVVDDPFDHAAVRSIFQHGLESNLMDRPVRYAPEFRKPAKRAARNGVPHEVETSGANRGPWPARHVSRAVQHPRRFVASCIGGRAS